MTEHQISNHGALCKLLSTNFMGAEKAEITANRAYMLVAHSKPLDIIDCKKNGVLLVAKRCIQPTKRIVVGISKGDEVYGVYDTNTKKLDKLSFGGYFAMLRSKEF